MSNTIKATNELAKELHDSFYINNIMSTHESLTGLHAMFRTVVGDMADYLEMQDSNFNRMNFEAKCFGGWNCTTCGQTFKRFSGSHSVSCK